MCTRMLWYVYNFEQKTCMYCICIVHWTLSKLFFSFYKQEQEQEQGQGQEQDEDANAMLTTTLPSHPICLG